MPDLMDPEYQAFLRKWYADTRATFNPALGVRLATNGINTAPTCSVCGNTIDTQLWAWRPTDGEWINIITYRNGRPEVTDHVEAFCLTCAAS